MAAEIEKMISLKEHRRERCYDFAPTNFYENRF